MMYNKKDIIDNAFHDCIRSIQDAIGQDDGGVAAVFFSDDKLEDQIKTVLADYFDLEMMYRRSAGSCMVCGCDIKDGEGRTFENDEEVYCPTCLDEYLAKFGIKR